MSCTKRYILALALVILQSLCACVNRKVLENNHFNKGLDQLIVFQTGNFVVHMCQRPAQSLVSGVSFNKIALIMLIWGWCAPHSATLQSRLLLVLSASGKACRALASVHPHLLSPPANFHTRCPHKSDVRAGSANSTGEK